MQIALFWARGCDGSSVPSAERACLGLSGAEVVARFDTARLRGYGKTSVSEGMVLFVLSASQAKELIDRKRHHAEHEMGHDL